MAPEIWKPVVGHPGYEVSDLGEVRSLPRTRNGRRYRGRRLCPFKDGKSYPAINLSHGPLRVRRTVHSLVADAFIGPRPTGLETRHLDGTRINSSLNNLAYGTRAENWADSCVNGARRRV